MKPQYVLTLSCNDRPGIVHRVTGFLLEHGANILEAAQFDDTSNNRFFMRIQFEAEGASENALQAAFAPIASEWSFEATIFDASHRVRTLLMVSKQGHCLNDLLFRWKSGLLPIDIPAIVSNHMDYYQLAASYNIPFFHFPITAETKPQQEAKIREVIAEKNIDLVVLARYMQVLSPELSRDLSGRAINIHHSFLPSFKGAKPYYQAHARGVKLIGATAHYVTDDLDEGPIIEQEVARVDHAMSVEALTNAGRDVECTALARAVKWHAEHRVLLNGHRTVVFR
ncbi:MAG: formyltetrahydrofolate deformylase [Burkholderiales bacterium]|nr:MAG: formyltetrahydrofolate deformylase [Betaproteobacteria bacterium]TAG83669.1 MAG: formyltetrahydrofolate deformylase [Burkholderiales bacterium]